MIGSTIPKVNTWFRVIDWCEHTDEQAVHTCEQREHEEIVIWVNIDQRRRWKCDLTKVAGWGH